ncbi:MAG: hypothetical protein OES46_15580 [Gammaproteobacteria bacterium]|jgi:hypothetical protein|nr:hypothetical protein [Gammaproteobacteria bacterium]
MSKFKGHPYEEPKQSQWTETFERFPEIIEVISSDPSSEIDNRYSVRKLLDLRQVEGGLKKLLVEPYDNGYYKKSDGKSTPLSFMRVPRFLRILGFRKDIVSVRHDYDYYKSELPRRAADKNYLTGQIAVGQHAFYAWIEYFFLRLAGIYAWHRHGKRKKENADYGTDEYIPQLEDKRGKFSSFYSWGVWLPLIAYGLMWLFSHTENGAASIERFEDRLPAYISGLLTIFGAFYLYGERTRRQIKPRTVVAVIVSILSTWFLYQVTG